MGFLNKIKDILFEDVEEERNEVAKKVESDRKPIAEKIEPQRKELAPEVKETPRVQPVSTPRSNLAKNNFDNINERDLFKSENTFPFPDFDEEEFSQSMNRTQKPKPTINVLEYEKKRRVEKKYDYGRFERVEKTEVVEKKKFKPSPIISPVYGILNEDYKPEDIKDKTLENASNKIDFNTVRKKAFGIEALEEVKPKETLYEETVTVKLKEPEEEKKKKVKTIDELLEDTADEAIEVEDKPISEYDKIEEELDEIKSEDLEKKSETEKFEDDDTLESDLFDLIDSMYDSREEGEY